MNYPASKDDSTSLPNPTGTSTQNNPDHAGLHTSENAAIIALEGKVGIGATTPAANTILFGTGAGTTAWQGLTSAQLAAVLSDETGSGSAVFANTPTLITPKVDTISESTPGNGVTVGGVSLKAGVITGTLPASSVTTTNLVAGSVTPPKISDMDWYKFIPGSSYFAVVSGSWAVTAGATSGNPLWWRVQQASSGVINDEISYKVVLAAGTYTVSAMADNDVNRGIATLTIDGATVGSTIDYYGASRTNANYSSFTTSYILATSKLVTVNIKMASKNASSSGYVIGLYGLEFRRTA